MGVVDYKIANRNVVGGIYVKKKLLLFIVIIVFAISACDAGQLDESVSISSEENTDNIEIIEQAVNDIEQDDIPAADNIGVIKVEVSRNCNYIYHMMAVSDCVYINEYGNTRKSLHPIGDLQILKNNEQSLTIKGGEYQGDLNYLFMICPAALDDQIPVSKYFEALADLFGTGEVERNFQMYGEIYKVAFSSVVEVSLEGQQAFYREYELLRKEIMEIATVMRDNYDIYTDHVWQESLAELSAAASELNQIFAENDFESRWEEVLEHKYTHDTFYALICNSMDNGPDCIDVSDNKDVFNIRDYELTAKRISHEFGIYILMDIFSDLEFQGYEYWGLKEGLAEYYNMIVSGGFPNWTGGEEYIDFYMQLGEENPNITAEEMFLQAVDFYVS